MIEHIILLRWQPDATNEQISAGMDALRGLQDRVPGIVSLACGADFSGRAQGYTHALVVQLADRAALAAYDAHPAHLAIIESHLKPILGGILELNFEAAPQG